jgi:hypothetical protein
MWSHLRPYELHTEPKLVLLPRLKPVQFVRVLVPHRMEERQRYRTSLLWEADLNPAFSRPDSAATVSADLRPRLAIISVTLPMPFGMFS